MDKIISIYVHIQNYVDAESRILKLLEDRAEDGILQSEITSVLNLSKSRVSEIISKLEEEKIVIRKKVSSKSYRVWLSKYSPEPIEGLTRIGILKASEYPKVIKAGKNAFIRVFNNSIELTKALISGYVDIAASPLITQVFFGVLMKNILIFRIVAMNGSGIVFSNSKSEYFGSSEFSTMERNLRRYLKAKGLKAKIRYFKSADDMIKNLNELRGLAIWEPYLTSLIGEKELFNEVIGDFVCCTLAVNKNFLEVNRDEFDEFLDRFDSARVHKSDAEKLSELIGFDKNTIFKSFSSYDFDIVQDEGIVLKELESIRFGGVDEILKF